MWALVRLTETAHGLQHRCFYQSEPEGPALQGWGRLAPCRFHTRMLDAACALARALGHPGVECASPRSPGLSPWGDGTAASLMTLLATLETVFGGQPLFPAVV